MAMLFFMPNGEQPRSFWMKNTLVSLDIIYLNADGVIVSMQENAQPLSTQSLPSTAPAAYVLEIVGGTAASVGLEIGTQVYWTDK